MDEEMKRELIELVRTGQLTDRLLVLEGVSLVPFLNQNYHSPYFYIGMCRRGEAHGTYNYKYFALHSGEICWLMPNHAISHTYISPDYDVLSVFIPKTYLEHLKRSGVLGKYQYLIYTPMTKLTPKQFETMYAGFKFLQQLSDCNHTHTDELISSFIHIIATLGDEFIEKQHPNITKQLLQHEQLFERFYDTVVAHYHESHEVAFYARQLCLSPKYFASVIKRTTGIAASEWISRHVIIKAKHMLSYESQKSIQQIAHELGFSEQSAFTRYFKTHVGITPKKFRESL